MDCWKYKKDALDPSHKFVLTQQYYNADKTQALHRYKEVWNIKEFDKLVKIDNHYYEGMIGNIRKIMFDIDNIKISRTDIDIFLNKFCNDLSSELGEPISLDDLCVKVNNHTEYIISMHIILKNFSMDIKQQKNLANNLKGIYDTIDTTIYASFKAMRLLYQTKLILQNKKVKLYALVKYNDFKTHESIVSYTYNTKKLDYIKISKCNIIGNKPPFIIEMNEVVDLLIGRLNGVKLDKTIYNNSNWILITKFIISRKILNLDTWNKYSLENATNKYNLKDNLIKFNELIENKDTNIHISSINTILTKHTDKSICINDNSINHKNIEFLKKYFNDDDIDLIIQSSSKKNQQPFKLYSKIHKKDVIINTRTGFIDETINYYNIYEDEELDLKYINNLQVEGVQKLDEFINSNKKGFFLKSAWGSGKTYHIIMRALEAYKDGKILVITESNSLNKKFLTDFKNANYNFVSHLDNKVNLYDKNKVICSIQSINKVFNKQDNICNEYDLVIIDEIESVLHSYSTDNTFSSANTTSCKAFNKLVEVIKTSNKTIFLDADICEGNLKLLKKICDNNTIGYVNRTKAFQDTKFNIILEKSKDYKAIQQILHDFSIKKVIVASLSNILIHRIHNYVCGDTQNFFNIDVKYDYKNKTFLFMCSNLVVLVKNGESISVEKDYVLNDIEKYLIDNKVDSFCYSPTIKTGISINKPIFNCCYAVHSVKSLIAEAFIQMIFRARILIDNEVNIIIQENFYRLPKIKTITETKNMFKNQIDVLKSLEPNFCFDYLTTNEFDLYFDLQSINMTKIINSSYYFAYELERLFNYHNLKFEYVRLYDYQNDYSTKTSKEFQLHYEYNEWIQLPLIPYLEYLEMKELKKENKKRGDKNTYRNFTDFNKKRYLKYTQLFHLYEIEHNFIIPYYLYYTKQYTIDGKSITLDNIERYKRIKSECDDKTQINKEETEKHNQYLNIIALRIDEFFNYIHSFFDITFYDSMFINRNKDIVNRVNYIIKNKNVKQISELGEVFLPKFQVKDKYYNQNYYIIQLIHILNVKFGSKIILSNKQFITILKVNIKIITDMHNAKHDTHLTKLELTKPNIKKVFELIKSLFNLIDFKMGYESDIHTSRPSDKIYIHSNSLTDKFVYYHNFYRQMSNTILNINNDTLNINFIEQKIDTQIDTYNSKIEETKNGFVFKEIKYNKETKKRLQKNTIIYKVYDRVKRANNKTLFKPYIPSIKKMNTILLETKELIEEHRIELNKELNDKMKWRASLVPYKFMGNID